MTQTRSAAVSLALTFVTALSALFGCAAPIHGRSQPIVSAPTAAPAPFRVDDYGKLSIIDIYELDLGLKGGPKKPAYAAVFAQEAAAGTQRVHFETMNDTCIQALIASPLAPMLVELRIGNGADSSVVRHLAAAENMTAIRALELDGNIDSLGEDQDPSVAAFLDEDLTVLLRAPHMHKLQSFRASMQGYCYGLEAFAAAPASASLEIYSKTLTCETGMDREVAALLSGKFTRLRVVGFGVETLNPKQIEDIKKNRTKLPAIETLSNGEHLIDLSR